MMKSGFGSNKRASAEGTVKILSGLSLSERGNQLTASSPNVQTVEGDEIEQVLKRPRSTPALGDLGDTKAITRNHQRARATELSAQQRAADCAVAAEQTLGANAQELRGIDASSNHLGEVIGSMLKGAQKYQLPISAETVAVASACPNSITAQSVSDLDELTLALSQTQQQLANARSAVQQQTAALEQETARRTRDLQSETAAEFEKLEQLSDDELSRFLVKLESEISPQTKASIPTVFADLASSITFFTAARRTLAVTTAQHTSAQQRTVTLANERDAQAKLLEVQLAGLNRDNVALLAEITTQPITNS